MSRRLSAGRADLPRGGGQDIAASLGDVQDTEIESQNYQQDDRGVDESLDQ
jgi:hypothetical protein